MKLTHLILPGAALGAAALLLAQPRSEAWSTLGGALSLNQRDARVFDNFSAASANNNTTPDANFPGYTGAEMAIWKGMLEWGSELHGDGNGDPHQPAGLGSGGANFDITWQGNATSIGTSNSNTHSQIGGSSGGVLAYCETPISDGWRIRYYQNWGWQDGPGTSFSGICLQGVACHEYGHALGLGHSNVGGATMFPSISGNGVVARSISADDSAGVQFIYGVKSASKPRITSIGAGNPLTIIGQNFTPTNNEVWFTQVGQGGTGDPIKVTGVSSNGSSITVSVPATAGPGDVLVKNGAANGFSNLSNAFPFDPGAGPSCGPQVFCTAKVASTGLTPIIGWNGTPTVSANDFELTNYNGGLPGQPGVYFWSDGGPNAQPFQGGFLCTQPPVLRSPAFTYDQFGFTVQPVNVSAGMVGITRRYQFWFRDPLHPDLTSVGLSDALEVTFCN